jgi:hypothetical protein
MARDTTVQALVKEAVGALFARDGDLLRRNVSERTIAARLAVHLAPLFPRFDVDVEYNRHGLNPKGVTLPADCRDGRRGRIFPDVIVHRRGHDRSNLLVIELKKTTNRESRACDRAKIAAMKDQLRYRYGVLIVLPAGAGATKRPAEAEWL